MVLEIGGGVVVPSIRIQAVSEPEACPAWSFQPSPTPANNSHPLTEAERSRGYRRGILAQNHFLPLSAWETRCCECRPLPYAIAVARVKCPTTDPVKSLFLKTVTTGIAGQVKHKRTTVEQPWCGGSPVRPPHASPSPPRRSTPRRRVAASSESTRPRPSAARRSASTPSGGSTPSTSHWWRGATPGFGRSAGSLACPPTDHPHQQVKPPLAPPQMNLKRRRASVAVLLWSPACTH